MKKVIFLLAVLVSVLHVLFAQEQHWGTYAATGEGKGTTRDAAIEAAQLDAINTLVFTVLRRDTLYRDLFASEALRDGRIIKQEVQKTPLGLWQASLTLEIDEGLAEALYVGRYSTTLTNLLDQAEEEILGIENLLEEAGQAESQGNLGTAETYYTQAQAKVDAVLRYLSPVEDAYYFSSQGKRKAPELKILLASYREESEKGIDRIRKAQSQLNMAHYTQQVLELFNQIEKDLLPIEKARDALAPLSLSPQGYTREQLESAKQQCLQEQNALSLQKNQFLRASEDLDRSKVAEQDSYIQNRRAILELKIKDLEEQLSSIHGKLSRELLRRSVPVTTIRWIFNHEPAQYLLLGLRLPLGLRPADTGPELISIPIQLYFAAEGAAALNAGNGFWGRTRVQAGSESLRTQNLANVQQELALGYYSGSLLGLGVRWDWNREEQKPITAIEVVWGMPGSSLGQKRLHPLWINTFSWEIPRETSHILTYVNLGVESVLRPNSFIGFSLNLASRTRSDSEASQPSWVGFADLDFNFRLPVLRPFQWELGWEGYITSPLTDTGVDTNELTGSHAFIFGVSYVF